MRDRGHASIELALAVGVLLLPVALLVTGFGPWSERRVEAEAVAAEAARAAVLDLSHDAGIAVVASHTSMLGISSDIVRVGWCGSTPELEPAGACVFERGAVVSITVELWTPLMETPWGSIGGLWVAGEHSEPIDLYRSLG
jgi:hypothetical protein